MNFTEPGRAFDAAIRAGRLSTNPTASNYAGHYMYMGTDAAGQDLFKHSDTRQYLQPANCDANIVEADSPILSDCYTHGG
jgi:hypothetical protein